MPKVRYFIVALLSLGFMASVQADPPWAREGGGKSGDDDRYEKHDKDRYEKDRYEKREKDEKRDRYEKHSKRERHDHFVDDDRVMVRDYYDRNPGNLPPGLAKRGGDLPPGLAKRGNNLPPGLSRGDVVTSKHEEVMLPLPPELEIKLPPPPHEVIRRILGHDIVMIDKQNKKVLDVMRDALPHVK